MERKVNRMDEEVSNVRKTFRKENLIMRQTKKKKHIEISETEKLANQINKMEKCCQ